MSNNTSTIKSLEQGRAKFAYESAYQVLSILEFEFVGQKLKTSAILRKLFENKFRNKIEINGKKDNENKKKEKEENKKILNDFLAAPLNKINDYLSGNKIKRDIANLYERTKKEYKSHVKKIPMLIKTNGLGATFAFMLSKGGIYAYIGEQVLEWLKNDEKGMLKNATELKNFGQLVKEVTNLESPEYRALTNEVLAFLTWLSRFAEGLIEGEAENE